MNPLTNIKSRQKQREQEVLQGLSDKASYHTEFSSSAYIYAGQLSFKLTEGDLLAIFAEYGEIVDVNLVRNKETGESRGFAFLAYEDQRSTNLAVDNLNGVSIDGRTIGVDHVKDYKRLVANPDAVHNPSAAPAAGASAAANSGRRPGGCLGQDHPPSDSPSPGSNRGMKQEASDVRGLVSDPARGGGASSLFDMLGEMEESIKKHRQAQSKQAESKHENDDPKAGHLQKPKQRIRDEVHAHKEKKHRMLHKDDTHRKDKKHRESERYSNR